MIIGIDFDGTCVTHEFPKIGISIGAERVLRRLVDAGHRLVLFTMRSDRPEVSSDDPTIHAEQGDYLTDAMNWFKERNIPLWGINENPEQKSWTDSPKAYCHLYIDDAALGVPLVHPAGERPFVWWETVEIMLEYMGVLPKTIEP
jgi:hypothetical protein